MRRLLTFLAAFAATLILAAPTQSAFGLSELDARIILLAFLAAFAAILILAAPAKAAFGLSEFDVAITPYEGEPALQAGAHPFAFTTVFELNSHMDKLGSEEIELPDGDIKDLFLGQMPGLIGSPTAIPPCPGVLFFSREHNCPPQTRIGTAVVALGGEGGRLLSPDSPVYNLIPPPGVAQKIGIVAADAVPATLNLTLSPDPPYNAIATTTDIANFAPFLGAEVTLWGVPADPAHDAERGGPGGEEVPYLTMPRSCEGPLATSYEMNSWQNPGTLLSGKVFSHDEGSLTPQGFLACDRLGLEAQVSAQPTTTAAQSPSGLDVELEIDDPGLTDPFGLAGSDIEKAVLTLPEGMSANPSLAEGLATCSEDQLDRESAFSPPGAGCPEASKVGTLRVDTPLVDESIGGSLYIATPYENLAGDSLIALYMVMKNANLGIVVKQALRVEPDPRTGQLQTVAEDIPELPFSNLEVHLREGARSPLISPPRCGTHTVVARLFPRAGGPPVVSTSGFEVKSGPAEAPCPPPGPPPFRPGFQAGTADNGAGRFSPFLLRLTRRDAEQDMTRFSAVLPAGVGGIIAGLTQCPDAAIAAAKARTGPHGAAEELADPSCPPSSRIGSTLAGAGVGGQLTYVPGSLYLAGPFGGDPLSVVAITPAKAGPFDTGTVVVRVALTLDPKTLEIQADGANSDPIPHILKGIPLNVRDLRVINDRPRFTFNATGCRAKQARGTLFGSYLLPLDPADDVPVFLSAPYRAAGCGSLGFKPRLSVRLIGGTARGDHPALRAIVTTRPGDANFASAVVTLPRSAFLDQAHIRTVCTRVQFASGQGNGANCPAGSIYGQVKAWTPVLDEPAQGYVILRSSDHKLPDLVMALEGPPAARAKAELSARIDSHKGGIRASFEAIPDFPVSRFMMTLQGGGKGLIVNSRDLCEHKSRAKVRFGGQNGRLHVFAPRVHATRCPKRR